MDSTTDEPLNSTAPHETGAIRYQNAPLLAQNQPQIRTLPSDVKYNTLKPSPLAAVRFPTARSPRISLGQTATPPAEDIPISLVRSLTIEYRTLSIQVTQDQNSETAQEVVDLKFHLLSTDEFEKLFSTSLSGGLESEMARNRLIRNGSNCISPPKSNLLRKLLGYVFGGFCSLLWVASIVCFVAWKPVGDPPDPTNLGLAILLLIVIFLQASFNGYQDWSSSQVMKSINNMLPATCEVTRDQLVQTIPVSDLVVGDVVHLRYGNKVPADVRVIESNELKFDKSVLTGENDPIKATVDSTDDNYLESRNIGLMGTLITNGNGRGVVVSTGDKTIMGKIAKVSVTTQPRPTTLQVEISRFVKIIATLALTTAAVVLVVWAAWLRREYPTFVSTSTALVNAIAVLVAFVPEGLPISVTLALTLVARKMVKQKVLVKSLMTVETLGSVNVIASDKTGTLTQNRMFVNNARVGNDSLTTKDCQQRAFDRVPGFLQLLASARLCNAASFDPQSLHLDVAERKVNGDATDTALLRFSASYPVDEQFVFEPFDSLFTIPFNSKNKWMLHVIQAREKTPSTIDSAPGSPIADQTKSNVFNTMKPVLLIKGAPDVLIEKCKWILNEDGTTRPFDDQTRQAIRTQQELWSLGGQRVLMLCKRVLNEGNNILPQDPSDAESFASTQAHSLCMIGLVGIMDPPRGEIPHVIRSCHQAGIRVFMVTGDFALTAAAIAKQVGIFSGEGPVDTVNNLRTVDVKVSQFPMPTSNPDDGTTWSEKPAGRTSIEEKKGFKYRMASPGEPTIMTTENNPCLTVSPALAKFHGSLLLSGSDLTTLTDEEWQRVTRYREIVFARTTPEQKLQIVQQFQKTGGIVGVTGDGVNDAPALKAANIGVAMGGGSEVAMEAAHMVMLDNNFASILVAIEYGRLVFDNLKKCILYLLPAGSFSECVPVLVSMFLGVPMPLSAFLMICICVLTDMPPSIALMFEGPERNLLTRPPRVPHRDRLVNAKLLVHAYLFAGFLETFFGHCMYFYYMQSHGGFSASELLLAFDKWTDGYKGYTQQELDNFQYTGQCIMFISLVMCQCFGNLLSIRTRYLSLFQHFPLPLPSRKTGDMKQIPQDCSTHLEVPSQDHPVEEEPPDESHSGRNPTIFLGWACSIGLALLIIYIPFFNNTFNTRPIPVQFFFMPIGYAMGMLLLDEIRKFMVRRKTKPFLQIAW
ncbi:hypothetical protein IWQ61_002144 [Dispira simplex]|nr:hypothetical protein IWQ61_002144 [Dispira simplex]